MPQFVEPELCRVVETPPSSGWVHEVKFDGYRMQLRVQKGEARLRTRRGLDWSARFPEIIKEGERLPDCLIDGEIVAVNDQGLSDFSALQAALSEGKTAKLIFYAFDILFMDGNDLRRGPLSARKSVLEAMLRHFARSSTRLRHVGHLSSHGPSVLNAACRMGLEGIISKRLDSSYRSGRVGDWTKAKCRSGQEVVIGGWWGDNSKLRSLMVGAYRDGELHFLGGVGTGFNARNATQVLQALRPLKQAKSPFSGPNKPPRSAQINWVKPKLVAEVEFASFTAAGQLRQASFKGLREDKPARSVVLEATPQAGGAAREKEETMAPRSRAAKARGKRRANRDGEEEASVAGIRITHPDKELWPATKETKAVSKLDLAQYYEAIASRMLPHIEARPLSLVRAPDGIEGERFFQRHALLGSAARFREMKVKGESKPFLALDSVEALVALAQAAVLELHPWGAKKGDPDTPARIVFDLDPAPDVRFDAVIAAAKEMRERVAAAGLEPYLKTTGGKGLHVTTPIKGTPRHPATWREAKDVAQLMCKMMERDSPQRYTTTLSKKARGGKIFLDYLRNDRFATAVAPWSPRARPGAPIAMPLEWSKLRAGLDPQQFAIGTRSRWLKGSDPWKDLDKAAAALDSVIRKLTAKQR